MINTQTIDLGNIGLGIRKEFEIPYNIEKDILNYFPTCSCMSVNMKNGKLIGSQKISKVPHHLKVKYMNTISKMIQVKKVIINYRDGSADIIEVKSVIIVRND